jgi:hypothetical protein
MVVGKLQLGVAAVGSVVMTALPLVSTATHSAVEGQETLVRSFVKSMLLGVLQVGVTAVGLVEITA